MVAMLLLPLRSNVKTALFLAPLVVLLALGAVFSQVKRQVLKLKAQGDFDGALRLDKRFSWIPGYGTSLEGVILFSAGRYHEAQALMKPLAFDRNGQPKLRSMELYIYTLALINDGRAADAQELLDAAVRVPQRAGNFHVSLATCLLSQNKDEERARELLEQAMSNWPEASGRYEARADLMRRIARYAWALAACGRREDAKAKLQESFAGADGFRDGDMAGLHYFAGETWRVLGDTSKSRAAFKEAMKLSPTGSAGMSAKKGLAKLADL
jgi:tetratricopeptide (TPR) repeat protein